MTLTLAFIIVLCIFLIVDFSIHRDILSPIFLNFSGTLVLFLIPSFFKLTYGQPISFTPFDTDQKILTEYANIFLFTMSATFATSFLATSLSLKNSHIPEFSVVFKSNFHFWFLLILGLSSFTALITLVPYNIWGTDAYYHMSGYGVANWLSYFTLFIPGFLFLGVKKHRWWSWLSFALFFTLTTVLLGRGTQTVFILLCAFVIIREYYKVSIRWQLFIFVGAPLLMTAIKFAQVYANDQSKTPWEIVSWFVTFDLGRFDYYASGLNYHLQGLRVDVGTIARYIPFATYLPVVRDLNDSFQALPEQLYLGARISPVGGIPFTANGEVVMFLGFTGILIVNSIWGILFAAIYSATRNSNNFYLLGFYAFFLYSARSLGFSGINALLSALIFLAIFCNIRMHLPNKAKSTKANIE
jgi:hypothetical protein